MEKEIVGVLATPTDLEQEKVIGSVKRIFRGFEPEHYEAYLYLYIDEETGRMYIGYHKGYVDDTYHHSSENEEFQEIFQNSDSNLTLKILDYGDVGVMKNKEYDMLINETLKDYNKLDQVAYGKLKAILYEKND